LPFPTYFFFSQWFVLPLIIIWSIFPIIYFCLRKKITIIHARNLNSGICAVLVSKILRVKVVFDVRGIHADEGVLIGRWKHKSFNYRVHKFLESWVLRSARSVLCISPNLCRYVTEIAPNVAPEFVPAMVDTRAINYSPELRAQARVQLNIGADDLCLIYTGTLGAWHHIEKLREQVVSFIERFQDKTIVLVILSKAERHKVLQQLNLSSRVLIKEVPVDQVNLYLNAADIGLLPAREIESNSHRLVFNVMISSKAEEYLCAGMGVCADHSITYFTNNNYATDVAADRLKKSQFFQQEFSAESVCVKIQRSYAVM